MSKKISMSQSRAWIGFIALLRRSLKPILSDHKGFDRFAWDRPCKDLNQARTCRVYCPSSDSSVCFLGRQMVQRGTETLTHAKQMTVDMLCHKTALWKSSNWKGNTSYVFTVTGGTCKSQFCKLPVGFRIKSLSFLLICEKSGLNLCYIIMNALNIKGIAPFVMTGMNLYSSRLN